MTMHTNPQQTTGITHRVEIWLRNDGQPIRRVNEFAKQCLTTYTDGALIERKVALEIKEEVRLQVDRRLADTEANVTDDLIEWAIDDVDFRQIAANTIFDLLTEDEINNG